MPFTVAQVNNSPLTKDRHAIDEATDRPVLWGQSVDGLQLGIRLGQFEKRRTPLRQGEMIDNEVWIKNETQEAIRIQRDPNNRFSPKLVNDQSINVIGWGTWMSFSVPPEELLKADLVLPPGEAAKRFLQPTHSAPIHKPGSPRGRLGSEPLLADPGRYSVFAQIGKLKSGIEEIDILPASRFQVRRADEVTDKRRELATTDPSDEILNWKDSHDRNHEVIVNWDSGTLVDESDIAAIEVLPRDDQPDEFSILIQLHQDSADWLASQTQALWQTQERNLLVILIDGKPLLAPRLNSPIDDGKLMITGRFTEPEAKEIANKLRALKNTNWLTAPQVCIGKAYSNTAKAANWKWDEQQHVALATPDSGAMLASCVPGRDADFVVQSKFRLEDNAACRLMVGNQSFETSLSGKQVHVHIMGEDYTIADESSDSDWISLTVRRGDNKFSVQINEQFQLDLETNSQAIEIISLQAIQGTMAVSNFAITGNIQRAGEK
ncbi:MAG: hypothetical protein KDB03_16995 [Planctomycetales bacterium]|nr:hypothetical protein [Planctomycetales bacterium]